MDDKSIDSISAVGAKDVSPARKRRERFK